jgi:hypothetical protein
MRRDRGRKRRRMRRPISRGGWRERTSMVEGFGGSTGFVERALLERIQPQ